MVLEDESLLYLAVSHLVHHDHSKVFSEQPRSWCLIYLLPLPVDCFPCRRTSHGLRSSPLAAVVFPLHYYSVVAEHSVLREEQEELLCSAVELQFSSHYNA